mgnify:CR=1 FL=1
MPLPKEIVLALTQGLLKKNNSSYLDLIPQLNISEFPDDLNMWDLAASGSEFGRKLHEQLDRAGLSKAQRAGMNNLLNAFCRMRGEDIKVGDIRALTEEELLKLSGQFDWGKPSPDTVKKVKRLLG